MKGRLVRSGARAGARASWKESIRKAFGHISEEPARCHARRRRPMGQATRGAAAECFFLGRRPMGEEERCEERGKTRDAKDSVGAEMRDETTATACFLASRGQSARARRRLMGKIRFVGAFQRRKSEDQVRGQFSINRRAACRRYVAESSGREGFCLGPE